MSRGDPVNLEVLEDRSAVEQVAELTMKAMRPQWLEMPDSDDDRRWLVKADGTLGDVYIPPRGYEALSVAGLIHMVSDLASIKVSSSEIVAQDDAGALEPCRVFVGNSQVTALLDERGQRCDAVVLSLNPLSSLMAAEAGMVGMKQADLVWKLRSLFPDRVLPATFVPGVKKLKFTSGATGGQSVGHGNETVDLEVEATVSGVEEDLSAMEEITLQTSVFEVLAAMVDPPVFDIRCAVHIDPQSRKFTIKPLEGEVARAKASARKKIVEMLIEGNMGLNVIVFPDAEG